MTEKWATILEYGNYEVSNLGRIRTKVTGRIRKTHPNSNGYPAVSLSMNNKIKTFRIHRLVAQAFIPNPDNKPVVNHKDSNTKNYSIDNLEWVTPSENTKHSFDSGRMTAFRLRPLINTLKELQKREGIVLASELINALEEAISHKIPPHINAVLFINT